MTIRMPVRTIGMALALALIAGCSGGEEAAPAPEPVDNSDMELIDQPPPPVETPTPEPTPEPSPPPVSPEADFRDSQQVLEDAEATGMTSRIDRSAPPPGEGEPPVVEETAPPQP